MRTPGREEEGADAEVPDRRHLQLRRYEGRAARGRQRAPQDDRRHGRNLDGELESFYYAFGENDVYSVVDLPDNVAAAAMGSHITAGGMVRCRITVLVTPEEMDKSARTKMYYRPPGD